MGRFNLPRSYNAARVFLAGRVTRKAAHNTFVRCVTEGYAVRYHKTDVVTFKADGRVIINTGGWDTRTTRDRIRSCGIQCFRFNGVTSITWAKNDWVLYDGLTLHPDGTVSGCDLREAKVLRAAERRQLVQENTK